MLEKILATNTNFSVNYISQNLVVLRLLFKTDVFLVQLVRLLGVAVVLTVI
jgi:hypothetical protein